MVLGGEMKKIILNVSLLLIVITNIAYAKTYSMEDMVVSATHSAIEKENMPNNIEIITQEEIKTSNSVTIGDLLKNILGITEVTKQGTIGSQTSVRIRSSESKYTYIMIDGQPINDLSLGMADISSIPIYYIERIEIVKGPASSVWGARGTSGVINIITKKINKDTFSGDTSVMIGDFGRKSISINANLNSKFYIGANRDYIDGWRDNSLYQNNNFILKHEQTINENSSIDFRVLYTQSETEVPGKNNTPIKNYNNNKELKASTPDARQLDNKIYLQTNYDYMFNNETYLKSKLYVTNTQRTYSDPNSFTNNFHTIESYGFNTTIQTPQNTSFGIDIYSNEYNNKNKITNTLDNDHFYLNKAIFAEHIIKSETITSILGLRYDDNTIFGTFLNPRLSIINHVSNKTKLSANIGKSINYPSFTDFYSPLMTWPASFLGSAGETQGNTNLQPETIWGYDIGIKNQATEKLNIKLNYFRNDITNLIKWNNVSTNPSYEKWNPVNIGQAYQEGTEFKINHDINDLISESLSYMYTENKGKETVSSGYTLLTYSPYNKIIHTAKYEYFKNSYVNLTTTFVDTQKTESAKTMPSYATIDFDISLEINSYKLFLSIENVLDHKYQNREDYPIPGREIQLGVKIKF